MQLWAKLYKAVYNTPEGKFASVVLLIVLAVANLVALNIDTIAFLVLLLPSLVLGAAYAVPKLIIRNKVEAMPAKKADVKITEKNYWAGRGVDSWRFTVELPGGETRSFSETAKSKLGSFVGLTSKGATVTMTYRELEEYGEMMLVSLEKYKRSEKKAPQASAKTTKANKEKDMRENQVETCDTNCESTSSVGARRSTCEARFNPSKVKLGIAPIAWTNDDMPALGGENTFEQCISEMALAGFAGCEIGTKYPTDAAVLKKALDLRGLQICNRWFSTFLISKPFGETEKAFRDELKFLKALGARVIGTSEQSYSTQGLEDVPIFGDGRHIMNDMEWYDLCNGLNRLGQIAREEGMTLTFHHHMGTVVQTAAEVDRLMENTDPEVFFLLYDSGHLAYCGEDYIEVLRKHVDRVRHVHLKDVRLEVLQKVRDESLSFGRGVREGAFTVPGDGCVDFDAIFAILSEAGYEGWMLVEAEQDPAKANPFEYAVMARRFIRDKTGL